MPTVKRIVCLANSRKIRGQCIAGKELDVMFIELEDPPCA